MRWNGPNATARVDRERAEQEPRAEIQYRARVEQNGKHLAVEGQILIKAGSNPLDALPVWIGQSAGTIQDWSFRAGPEEGEIAKQPLDEPMRSALKLPATGMAWSLAVKVPELGKRRVDFKTRLPWNQHGSVPLLLPAREFLPRSTVLIEVPPRMRSDVQSTRLRRLDTTVAERLAGSWRPVSGPAPAVSGGTARSYLVAHAFTYTEPEGKLELSTEELLQTPELGIMRDVCLTTILHPGGPWLNRLRLLLHAEQLEDLRCTMPADTRLVRVQLDGLNVVPVLDNGQMVIPLERGGPGSQYKTVDLHYETTGQPPRPGVDLRPCCRKLACLASLSAGSWSRRRAGRRGRTAQACWRATREPRRAGPSVHSAFRRCTGPVVNGGALALRRNAAPAGRDLVGNFLGRADLRRMVHSLGFGSNSAGHRPPGTERCRSRTQVAMHPDSPGPQGTARLTENASAIRPDPAAPRSGTGGHIPGRGGTD